MFFARSSRAARMLDEQVSTHPGTLPHPTEYIVRYTIGGARVKKDALLARRPVVGLTSLPPKKKRFEINAKTIGGGEAHRSAV